MKKILALAICIALIMISCSIVSITATAAGNVVKIVETGTEYATFKAAFNAVENGQTIQLLNNVEEGGYLSKPGLKDCTITIDFNGYYYAEKGQRWLSFDSSTTGFTINMENGTLKAYETNSDLRGFVCLRSGCTYNFTDMVIDCCPAGKNYGGGTVAMAIVADATVNFRNCTITDNGVGTPAGGLIYYNAWTNATVNYYNTNVTSYTALFNNKGTTLYSGTFEAVGSLNIGTYTVAATSTATTAGSKKVVVECNHNYVDGVCEYCFADKPASAGPEIVMDSGAAMRIDNATDGIRFSATVDKTALDEFGCTVTDAGMLVAKESAASAETLTVDNSVPVTSADQTIADGKVLSARYNGVTLKTAEDANKYVIIGSLIEISEKNANQKYVARAFIEYTDAEGQKAYLYSDLSTARSIAEVASLIQQEGLAKPDDDTVYYNSLCGTHKDVVDFWAEKYSS